MMYLRLMYDYMDVNLLSILDHLVKLGDTEIIMHVAFCILVLFNPSNGTKILPLKMYYTHHEGNVYLRWGKSMLM